MAKAVKIAITLPAATFRSIEKLRRKRKVSRSALILEAVEHWRQSAEREKVARQYIEGYLKKPESRRELGPFTEAQAEVMAKDRWE